MAQHGDVPAIAPRFVWAQGATELRTRTEHGEEIAGDAVLPKQPGRTFAGERGAADAAVV